MKTFCKISPSFVTVVAVVIFYSMYYGLFLLLHCILWTKGEGPRLECTAVAPYLL